jgi:two-component system sensor histidine kinase KdpD
MSAALWTWGRAEPAGRGTDTLPAARWAFVPVRSGEATLAALGASPGDEDLAPTDLSLLALLADRVGLALARELEGTRVASEAERLRAALLNSVSHDLRTPLVSIIGAAGALAEAEVLTDEARATLVDTIREEGERMDRYVQNLLDMTRLGHGALKARAVPVDVDDLVGDARHRLAGALRGHPVLVDPALGLPPVAADPVLIEQVLVDVLDNAAKYAPTGTPVRIEAQAGWRPRGARRGRRRSQHPRG